MSETLGLRFGPTRAEYAPSAEMVLGAKPFHGAFKGVAIPFCVRGLAGNPALGSAAGVGLKLF